MKDIVNYWEEEWRKITDYTNVTSKEDLIMFPSITSQSREKPMFKDLLNNYPKNAEGGDLPAPEVFKLIGGVVYEEHLNNPSAYNNACALRVSRALNESGVEIPNIKTKTLKGVDNKYYIFRVKDLFDFLIKLYGKPDISSSNNLDLNNYQGIYIMQAHYSRDFGAWGHATLWDKVNTIGPSYIGNFAYKYFLWTFK
jgi:hypothetical protein